MLYTIGSRVKLKQTGDTGSVNKILGEELVEVELDGGLGAIPVPTDSLTYEHDQPPSGAKSDGARFVTGKTSRTNELEPTDLGLGYTILKPWGLQLAFDPVINKVGDAPQRYRVYLINDTSFSVIYRIVLSLVGQETWSRVGTLEGTTYQEVGELKHGELNDQPVFELEVRRQLARGTGPRLTKVLKLKPKHFFKQQLTAPLLNRRVHHYTVIPKLDAAAPSAPLKRESLASLTHREAGKARQNATIEYQETTPNPLALAQFPRSIDLHIEALLESPSSVPKGKHLSTQLRYFRDYMHRAHRLGIDQVFIIHGVGSGKLKDAVGKELERMSFVQSFKNEYHAKYGSGATEVRL